MLGVVEKLKVGVEECRDVSLFLWSVVEFDQNFWDTKIIYLKIYIFNIIVTNSIKWIHILVQL